MDPEVGRRMTLVYVGVALGVVGLIVEMGLDYRRRASELRADQDEIRGQTAGHVRRTRELKQRVQATLSRTDELEGEKRSLTKELKVHRQLLKETEEDDRKRNPTRFLFKAQDEGA